MNKSGILQNAAETGRKGIARELGDWLRRVATSGKKPGNNLEHAPYRKCPSCGEPKFRISDRQRARPDLYRSRTYRVTWLCLSCGKREIETVVDP
jgi:predicted RNA-binding Zn-ribbon protein involved in translation (DUF1610 family)